MVTFITSNQHKVELMSRYLGVEVGHKKVELEELQSLDLHQIVDHKVRQAFAVCDAPVLVEDVGLYINSLGKLPGPLVKWFLEEIGTEGLCKMADMNPDRSARVEIVYGYYDGQDVKFFEGEVKGSIASRPRGEDFGWNPVFIPEGSHKTYAEMDDKEYEQYGLRTSTVFPQLKVFLTSISA
jgi:non-canonical purine NTP pyrophosphatase (RdgB/HAM1 family)